MRTTQRVCCLAACMAAGILVMAPAMAAQDQNKAAEKAAAKAARKAAFLRGDASTRAKPVVPPRSEREAVAAKRVLANGIVEMHLPEDRMLELVAVKQADGTVVVGHGDAAPARKLGEAVE